MLEQMREGVRLELEDARRLAGVKEANHIEAEVALQPVDVRIGAMHHFGDAWVGESLVQHVQRGAQLDGVDQEVLFARRDLHQADEAAVGPIRVALKIDSDLRRRSQSLAHVLELRFRFHPCERRRM